MLIDWFTVIAQIVNFLILLALLKWLLFDRIVRAMDEREEKIAARLHEAEDKQEEARQRAEKLEQQQRQLDARRAELLEEARREADEQRHKLVQQAREEIQELRHQWQQDWERQRDQFVEQLTRQAADALRQAVRQAVTELAHADLQQSTVGVFMQQLEALDGEQRDQFVDSIRDGEQKVVVAAAEQLASGTQDEITRALKRQFPDQLTAAFETRPELICGVELRSGGQSLGWSLRDYLEQFEQALGAAVREESTAGARQSEAG